MSVTEMLVRGILSHHTQPAVMFLNIAASGEGSLLKPRCNLYNTCYTFNRIRLPILRAYAVPMLSQRDALWSNFSCPPPWKQWMCSKGACNHPLKATHAHLAEMVTAFLMGESAAMSSYALTLLPQGQGLDPGLTSQGQGLGPGSQTKGQGLGPGSQTQTQGLAPRLPSQFIAPRSYILANR